METCYLRALEVPSWATTQGRLTVRLAIDVEGSIAAAQVVSNQLVPELGCCVQNAASQWRLPENHTFRVVERSFMLTHPTDEVDVQLAH